MKNFLKPLILFLFIFSSTVFFAQNAFMSWKAGFLSSNLFPKEDNSKNRNAFTFGLDFQFNLTEDLSVSVLTNFIPAGNRVKDDVNDFKLKNNYLQFALKPFWYIHDDDLWDNDHVPGIFINAGPYVSYLLSSKTDGMVDGREFNDINTKGNYKEFDYGIVIGGGVSALRAGFLQFNYYFGLSEIQQNSELKNNYFEISLMSRIPKKIK